MSKVTYKVSKNDKYGDYRVGQYSSDGTWINEFDNNWSKKEANEVANYLSHTDGLEYYGL